MVSIPPMPPPMRLAGPRSRLPLARRVGIGVCAVAVGFGALVHAIGWHRSGIAAGAVAGIAVLVIGLRTVQRRRSGPSLPPGLRGMPGMRGGRMPRMPRGLGRPPRGMRMPRGGLPGLPGGRMNPHLARAMRGAGRSGPLRIPRKTSRMRMPGLPGRPRTGALRPRASGSPAFRARGGGARPGGARGPGALRPGRARAARPGSAPRAPGGARPRTAPVRGWRRLVPPAMRPPRWSAPRATGGGAPRGGGAHRAPGHRRRWYAPWRAAAPARAYRRRWRRRPPGAPLRATVRGGRRRMRTPWRRARAARVRTIRPHRLRPFSKLWIIHHVGRYGRARVRRRAARGGAMVNGWRRMLVFLISWNSRRTPAAAAGGPASPPAPDVVITPPRRASDPDAHRRPSPAASAPSWTPFTGAPAGSAQHPATGGTPMASSAAIDRIVEEINSAFGGFRPERLMPDVENFLENLPEVFRALNDQIQKVSGHFENDMPVNGAVADALNEVRPHMDRAAEAATEALETFKRVHENDRKRYHEPRTQEHRANVD